MSQKSLEIVGEEWIAPSLVESKYSGLIAVEDSITTVDSIPAENFTATKYSLDSGESITAVDSQIDSGDYLVPVNFISSEAFLSSEGFLTSADSFDSEYPSSSEAALALEYSLPPEDSIFLQETNSENSLTSSNPISLQYQERTAFDPLTGIANNAMSSGSRVNALRQPTLSINLSTGIPNYAVVTTTVKVELSPLVKLFL